MPQPYSRASNTSRRWRRNGANPDIDSRHPRVTVRLHKATPHRRLGNNPYCLSEEFLNHMNHL